MSSSVGYGDGKAMWRVVRFGGGEVKSSEVSYRRGGVRYCGVQALPSAAKRGAGKAELRMVAALFGSVRWRSVRCWHGYVS